jgi:hypothetical protein
MQVTTTTWRSHSGANGEGYDISIDRKNGQEKFSLTFGEFDLLTVLMNWKG